MPREDPLAPYNPAAAVPDLLPLGFAVGAHIKAGAAKELPEMSKPAVARVAIRKVTRNIPQSYVEKVIGRLPGRLRESVSQKGGQIRHAI